MPRQQKASTGRLKEWLRAHPDHLENLSAREIGDLAAEHGLDLPAQSYLAKLVTEARRAVGVTGKYAERAKAGSRAKSGPHMTRAERPKRPVEYALRYLCPPGMEEHAMTCARLMGDVQDYIVGRQIKQSGRPFQPDCKMPQTPEDYVDALPVHWTERIRILSAAVAIAESEGWHTGYSEARSNLRDQIREAA